MPQLTHIDTSVPGRRGTTPHWVSLEDAAEYMGVHVRTCRRLIADGSISGYRLGKRAIRVDRNELDAVLRPIPSAAS